MHADFLDRIDWQRPWLAPYRAIAKPLLETDQWRIALNQAATAMELQNHRGLPLRFVPQENLPPHTAYEAFISATGNVPTRENLHDFFNALVWLRFPAIKQRLNELQAAAIEQATAAAPGRGPLRDAATLFDENAALLVVRNAGWIDALRAHCWHTLFVQQRAGFAQDCEVWLFGHALLEKLVSPYKAITAHAWALVADEEYFRLPPDDKPPRMDRLVANSLSTGLSNRGFTPLPVLGVPGWWDGQDRAFYADATVFRASRLPRKAG